MTITPTFTSIVGGSEGGTGLRGATVSNAPLVASNATLADTLAAAITTGGTNYDAVVAALAVLVADGASPTQAHVTTLNDAFTLLAVDCAAVKVQTAANAGTGVLQGYDVVLMFDAAVVTTQSKLRAVLRELQQRLAGNAGLTP